MNLLQALSEFVLDADERSTLQRSHLHRRDCLHETMARFMQDPATTAQVLSAETGIPTLKLKGLLGLYGLCSSLDGLGPKRAQLFYRAGIFLPEHLSGQDAERLHQQLKDLALRSRLPSGSCPSVTQIRAWQWVIAAGPPVAAVQGGALGEVALPPARELAVVPPAAEDATASQVAPQPAPPAGTVDALLAEGRAWSRRTQWSLTKYVMGVWAIAVLLSGLGQVWLQESWGMAVAKIGSASLSAALLILCLVGASVVYSAGSNYLSSRYLTRYAAQQLDAAELARLLHWYRVGLDESPLVYRLLRWGFAALLLLIPLSVAAFVVLQSSPQDFQAKLLSRGYWLVLSLFGWALLGVAYYMRAVQANSRLHEGGELSGAANLRIVGFVLQGGWAAFFLLALVALLPLLVTWTMRLNNLLLLIMARWSPELSQGTNPAFLFSPFMFTAEDGAQISLFVRNVILLPGLVLIGIVVLVFIVLVQPRRILVYLLLVIAGGFALDSLVQWVLTLWGYELPSWADWGLKLLNLIVSGVFLDSVFNLVSRTIKSRPVLLPQRAFVQTYAFQVLLVSGVIAVAFGGAASFGLIPWVSQLNPLPGSNFPRPAGARQDGYEVWMTYVDALPGPFQTTVAGELVTGELTGPFWMDITEVTNTQYQQCVHEGFCQPPARDDSLRRDAYYANALFDAYPVIQVSLEQARRFCQWRGGRLPAEAEWLFAAQSNDGRRYPWGNQPDRAGRLNYCDRNCIGWWRQGEDETWRDPDGRTFLELDLWDFTMISDRDLDDGYSDTSPVGTFPAGQSPFGVLDLAGNVAEWTREGVLVGGAFSHAFERTGLLWRHADLAGSVDQGFYNVGLRCVKDSMP